MEYIQENERTPKKDEGGINLRDVVELIIATGTGLSCPF